MNKLYEYFDKENDDYDIRLYLVDAEAPIKEDANLLAQYIDTLALNPKTKSISLIGISECETMAFYVPNFFKEEDSYKKTNIYTIGSPFNGTIAYSPKYIYELIKDRIISIFGDTFFSEVLCKRVVTIYKEMLISSHRFHDVSVINGISCDKLEFYDSSFIREMFSKENLRAIRKVNVYRNFILQINSNVVMGAIIKPV